MPPSLTLNCHLLTFRFHFSSAILIGDTLEAGLTSLLLKTISSIATLSVSGLAFGITQLKVVFKCISPDKSTKLLAGLAIALKRINKNVRALPCELDRL